MKHAPIFGLEIQRPKMAICHVNFLSQPNVLVSIYQKEPGMVDLDPEIWNNKTLGEAATNGFADEKELQEVENAAAAREGREPWIAQRLHRYPGSHGDIQIESSYDNGMRLIDPALNSGDEFDATEDASTEEHSANDD